MVRSTAVLIVFVGICCGLVGCQSTVKSSTEAKKFDVSSLFKRNPQRQTEQENPQAGWTPGNPILADRWQSERPIIDRRLATFADSPSHLQLASHTDQPLWIQLTAINEQAVYTWQDVLKQATAMPTHRKVQIDYREPQVAASVDSARMATASEVWNIIAAQLQPGKQLRWTEEGTERVTFRQGPILATVWARKLNAADLLQVYMHIRNTGDSDVRAPLECFALASNQPLQCLNAKETLAKIYREPDSEIPVESNMGNEDRSRYSFVAGQSNFLDLTTFDAGMDVSGRRPTFLPPYLQYPGPADRFDAIALGGSLLQPTWLEPGATVDGWIIFDGSDVPEGNPLELRLLVTDLVSTDQMQILHFNFQR